MNESFRNIFFGQLFKLNFITKSSQSDIDDSDAVPSTNLKEEYNVKIKFTGCSKSKRLVFDDFGRPHCAKSYNSSSLNPYEKLLDDFAKIELEDLTTHKKLYIYISPITGYSFM